MDYSCTLTSRPGANQPPAYGISAVQLLQSQLTHTHDHDLGKTIASSVAARAPHPSALERSHRVPTMTLLLHPPASPTQPLPHMGTARRLLVDEGPSPGQPHSPGHGLFSKQLLVSSSLPDFPVAVGVSSQHRHTECFIWG